MDLNKFFSMVFEWLGYAGTFSDDLFQEELYTSIGLITAIVSLTLVITFYFIKGTESKTDRRRLAYGKGEC